MFCRELLSNRIRLVLCLPRGPLWLQRATGRLRCSLSYPCTARCDVHFLSSGGLKLYRPVQSGLLLRQQLNKLHIRHLFGGIHVHRYTRLLALRQRWLRGVPLRQQRHRLRGWSLTLWCMESLGGTAGSTTPTQFACPPGTYCVAGSSYAVSVRVCAARAHCLVVITSTCATHSVQVDATQPWGSRRTRAVRAPARPDTTALGVLCRAQRTRALSGIGCVGVPHCVRAFFSRSRWRALQTEVPGRSRGAGPI